MASQQQSQGRGAPEEPWISFISSMYPNLLQATHFFPPLFFNRVPHTVENILGLTARVTLSPLPPARKPRKRRGAGRQGSVPAPQPPPPSEPSIVFADNPGDLRSEYVQESDRRDDKAQYQCLKALGDIGGVMMVISQMVFRKYLDDKNNPQHHINPTNIISQLPSIRDPSLPPSVADRECDIIVLHRQYGILVGEVKSVGEYSPSNQDHIIAKTEHAIKQLAQQEIALKHLVRDMVTGNIRVTKALLLPNISSAQLTAAANNSQELREALCQCTQSQDVPGAVSRCLCSDQFEEPLCWWNALWTWGPDPSMSDDVYKRLCARFCGPASTVDIPTAGHPCRVLRDLGQAVAETALRFSSLVLTPDQVGLLNADPGPSYMYLQGPPGCGKTIVLLLKALQWARRGGKVLVVGESENKPVGILVEKKLERLLGPAAAGSVQRHVCDMDDVQGEVAQLRQLLGPDLQGFILFDEVPHISEDFIPWLTAVQDQLPNVRVWAAGLCRWDNKAMSPLPEWLEVCTLSHPLRCPPAITTQVGTSGVIDGFIVPEYSDPVLPLPTEGPPVRRQRHRRQEGHRQEGGPWKCESCADVIADTLRELRVGDDGRPQLRDVWILCEELYEADDADVIVKRLRDHHGVRVRAVSRRPSEEDALDLAMAVSDEVVVTGYRNVQGLEKPVVFAMRHDVGDVDECLSWSRSTSFLCIIE